MDPNLDKPTSFNLPAPMESGSLPAAPTAQETLPQSSEFAVNPSQMTPVQQPASLIVPPAVPTTPAASVGAMPIPTTDSPAAADDTDLIEKEWVNKAKAIVERTREDPYTQNRELNKFKADYMQKRYNKEIKISE